VLRRRWLLVKRMAHTSAVIVALLHRCSRNESDWRRSAGLQTGLTCSQIAKYSANFPRTLSRFGNRRSAKAAIAKANS
jgi:hypothetical protein